MLWSCDFSFRKQGFLHFFTAFNRKKSKHFNLVLIIGIIYSKFTFWAGEKKKKQKQTVVFFYSVTSCSHLFTFMLKLKTVCKPSRLHEQVVSDIMKQMQQLSGADSGLDCTATRVLFMAKAVRMCWSTFTSHSCETLTVCMLQETEALVLCQSIPAGTWRSRFCSSRRAGWDKRADSDRSATSAAAVTTNLSANQPSRCESLNTGFLSLREN